jgi:CRP-like cAMP-binding protein
MEGLRTRFEKIINITDEEWKQIKQLFTSVSFKRKTIIQRQGTVFDDFYYLESGTARSYFLDYDGTEITWQLYFNTESSKLINIFLDDSISHYHQIGTPLTFEALENCEFSVVPLAKMEELFQSEIKWQYLGRMISHSVYYKSSFDRALALLSKSAPERYMELVNSHPTIFNLFKSHIIASYLGIAPQTLSKIRKSESR